VTGNKLHTVPAILKQKFYELLSVFNGLTQIYTDGSKEGKRVAAAMVYRQTIIVTARLPDNSSIFSAELHAILLALDFIGRHESRRFVIFSDALSCLQAIHNLKWSIPLVRDILEHCHFLSSSGKEIHFCWVPSHVGIPGNEKADIEAKATLELPTSDCQVPHGDYKQMITLYLKQQWQAHWDNIPFNKLQAIKKTVGITNFSEITRRRDEIVLHRARIGHTHLTHCYLLKAEEQPQCHSCHCALSVQHILVCCPYLNGCRQKYFNVSSLSELFSHFSVFKILSFLRETGFYQRF